MVPPAGSRKSVAAQQQRQQQPFTSSNKEEENCSTLWRLYRNAVREHSVPLHLLENALSQLLFWTPQSNSVDDDASTSRWGEVLYGLLSLHQMATDIALQEDELLHKEESYGTTVEVKPNKSSTISPTNIRIAIAVVHNLLPTILQLCRGQGNYQRVRFILEQIKFMLRMILAGSYWYQQQSNTCGIIMDGGMYDGALTTTTTVEDVVAWRQRQSYVGRRTGRTVLQKTKEKKQVAPPSSLTATLFSLLGWNSDSDLSTSSMWPLLVGECLHIYRPLHWAGIEAVRRPSLQDWIATLGMDVVSLLLLLHRYRNASNFPPTSGNALELKRRKRKLFLYLLRSPIWDRYTEPMLLRKTGVALRHIPLLGPLFETYLWDWLLYWKHPFVAEYD